MANSFGSPNPSKFPFFSSSSSSSSKPNSRFTLSFGNFVNVSSALMHGALVAKGLDQKEKRLANSGVAAIPFPKNPSPFANISGAPEWLKWILGTMMLLVVPSYKKAICIEEQVEKAAGTVLKSVEAAAKVTDQIAHEIEENLPADAPLKKLALAVEKISEEVGKDAELAETLIKKVDDVVEGVESTMEPILEQLEGIPAVKKIN